MTGTTRVENVIEELNALNKTISGRKFPWRYWWGVFAAFSAPLVYLIVDDKETLSNENGIIALGIGVFSAMFYATLIVGVVHKFKTGNLEKKRHELLMSSMSKESDSLQDDLDKNFFITLVKINFKYIDKYYLQTQVQADKSFKLCVGAAVTGLAIIVSGLIMLYFDKTEVGNIAASAGVLGEFIASVFFYLYNKTVSKMADYHQKLVLTQNISLALKVADELPEKEKAEAKLKLVDYLSKDVNSLLVKNNH